MAYISFQPSDFFNTVLYTGTGATRSVTGVGFQPDWTWIKARSFVESNMLYDSTRGATKDLRSDGTNAENTNATGLTSFDSDGFSLGSMQNVNNNTSTYASWNWLANGGTTSSNTDGSITSTVQASTTSGFSIVTFTGTGADGTVGHGLGGTPEIYIRKSRTNAENWFVFTTLIDGSVDYLYLNTTDAKIDSGATAPTSTVFSVGAGESSGEELVTYCFRSIKGYSKFGKYTGNGSTNGTYVYTGFRPAFVMTKRTNAIGPWNMKDTKRPGYNDTDDSLFADSTAAEDVRSFDILSNGFKLRNSGTEMNGGGSTYIYMAFAEFPVVGSNGIAGTAR